MTTRSPLDRPRNAYQPSLSLRWAAHSRKSPLANGCYLLSAGSLAQVPRDSHGPWGVSAETAEEPLAAWEEVVNNTG